MNSVFIFLKKNAARIIVLSALAFLIIYLNPLFEKEYLSIDLNKLQRSSRVISICLTALACAIVLFIFFKKIKGWKESVTVAFNMIWYGIAFFFLLNPFVYCALLGVNKMQPRRVSKKYIVRAVNVDGSVDFIYDIEQKKAIYTDQLSKTETTKGILWEDTLVVSFNRGLLGINFHPMTLSVIFARPHSIPVTAFRIVGKDSIYWYDVKRIHGHKNNAYINIYSNSDGRLVLGKQFDVICEVVDTLQPIWINNLQEQIIGFDGKKIALKRGEAQDTCWMQ